MITALECNSQTATDDGQGSQMQYLDTEIETANSQPIATPSTVGPGSPPERPEGLDGLLTAGTSRMVKTREHLFKAGEPRCHVYRVESGSLCLYRVIPDGRRQVLNFAFAGDFMGLGFGAEHACNAQALEPLRVKCLDVAALTCGLESSPWLGVELYEAISRELTVAHNHLFAIGQRSADERVACFLLVLSRQSARCGEEASTVVLPMTRSDIADFLSLTVETVSRTLSTLRAARVIDLEQSIIVSLLDIGRLERLAAGESAIQPARATKVQLADARENMPPTRL